MDEGSYIDESAVAKLQELGDEAFVVEMIDAFFSLIKKSSAEARTALAAGHLDPVIRMGHSLKSSACIMGAHTLRDIAVRIERHAREKRIQELPGLLDEFDRVSVGVKAHLEKIQMSVRPP